VFVSFTITFNEPISVTPEVSYLTAGIGTLVQCEHISGATGQTTFVYRGLAPTLAGQDGTATITIANAQDMSGNVQVASPFEPFTFVIDASDPVISALTVLPATATAGDGGPASVLAISFLSDELLDTPGSSVTVGGFAAGFDSSSQIGPGQ